TRATSCPRDWLYYQGHCYGFFPEEKTWSDAEVECQYQRLGAHLVSILSKAEGDTVANYITMSGYQDHVWIGLHDSRQNRRWKWTDGSIYLYRSWKTTEPNNKGGIEFCTELRSDM
ncbi:regenerating islet-derived protein 4-like, partial [Emydura macquarii macquarii]|uniref:regenerating islet-derived protein 4-like n=1 Tax=Emydura macquarii macquarii TaxID=1129001 RepID=UPI00352BC669